MSQQPPRRGSSTAVWATVAGLGVAVTVVLIIVLVSQDSPRSRSEDSGGTSEASDLPPPPADRRAAGVWLDANAATIDAFARAAPTRPLTAPADCEAAGQRLSDAVGPLGDYLGSVQQSPDPVLAELLGNNAQAARVLLAACQARDEAQMEEERRNLEQGLRLVDARSRQIR